MKKFILALFILYLPFQLRLFQIPVINTLNFFLILLSLILVFSRNPQAKMARLEIPLFLFLFFWVASYVHTLFLGVEVWHYEIAVQFKRLISLVLVYFVFSRCIKTKKEWQFLFYALLLSLVFVALVTWRGGMLAGSTFADFKRSSGPFGEDWRGSDIAGGFLAIFTPFILSFTLFTKRRIIKILGFGSMIICVMGLFATYSRGSIMALGIASLVSIIVGFKALLKTSKFTAVLVIIIIFGLALYWQKWVPESIVNRIKGTVQEQAYVGEVVLDESSQGRMDKWETGIEIFKTNFLFGVGFKIPNFMLGTDTHNTFIQIAAEMGIFGFLAFLIFLFTIFIKAKSLLKTEFAWLGVGLIGCLVAFIFVNMFYSNFFRDTVVGTFWVILGLSAAATSFDQPGRKVKVAKK
jgi:O-antigen ligase